MTSAAATTVMTIRTLTGKRTKRNAADRVSRIAPTNTAAARQVLLISIAGVRT